MSICPKNKMSKSRRNKRRSGNYKMQAPTLIACSHCGELCAPHKVCKACGYYNKKSVVAVEN